ncbi:hypothetical protein HNY73_006506 [Argiope bruennichi]|uniref:Uncharacterized protein n=1 Tax=Argiope bruennichi TaxID=94029 RepID=A0A8T0FC38_ARGBR|nr:hypothetical protein HNY73_006506 [Argiope bruennichi]
MQYLNLVCTAFPNEGNNKLTAKALQFCKKIYWHHFNANTKEEVNLFRAIFPKAQQSNVYCGSGEKVFSHLNREENPS